ncbi:DNA-binding transcriptional LysR family regulator [Methylopila capsulata]|uniref:DNA-binding transcriptional LysR family regulator n=1 Tax=Methylopila capsulata TaxID=61654 RepID=A0A9W6ISN4_9HYPH|nr:LysR family transcriptional regulator [Methylopila capsulata]MBM7850507.1 DNA-binding transcriptional LysR family regulator [Methylopila capsulata]GLK55802.1 LysR family transcriptional regulator [Methylopila capsulata]
MLDKLDFLLALAQERHFGRAAETCGVTQPTLSAGVKQLEDALGVRLVERGSRFHGFTPEGQRALEWARRIVGDARAMRQDIDALKRGVVGHLRIAVIPTALPMVAQLTTPYRAQHPDVRFTILSSTSLDIGAALDNLEVDAGITYLDNEPLGRVSVTPIWREGYRLITAADGEFGAQETVTWRDVGRLPLCLLTPDMQNRRIVETLLREAGASPSPTLESNDTVVLLSHVRTGAWSSVLQQSFTDVMGLPPNIRSIPIVDPEVVHTVGLVVPHRDPTTPATTALVATAKALAARLASV